MIYQTDEPFPTIIHDAGCYFLALLWQLESWFSLKVWSYSEIMRIYENEELDHDLRSDMEMLDPQGFCDDVVGEGRVLYVGKALAEYVPGPRQFELLQWKRDGVSFKHFTSGSPFPYDPYSPEGALSVKNGKVIGKRIFTVLDPRRIA